MEIKYQHILKPSVIVQYKWLCNKNSCFFVKYICFCHKTLYFPVLSYYIFWIYVFVCTYVYHESARMRLRICMFMFSLLFLGLQITVSLCLSPIIRFNKANWLYLQSLYVWVFYTIKTVSSHSIHTGFLYWSMYLYMYFWERQPCCVKFWLSIFRDKMTFSLPS